MKIFSQVLLFAVLLIGCKNDIEEQITPVEIDCTASRIDGSFVQNTNLNSTNRFHLALTNKANGVAQISAKEVNGVFINNTQVDLKNTDFTEIIIDGKPIELGEFALKIKLTINGKDHFCSQIFEVFEDTDPNAPIIFTLNTNEVKGLQNETTIPFTVDPPGASVVVASPVQGITVQTQINKKTGEGTLLLTPSESFIEGTLTLSITYGVRQEVTKSILLGAFENGDGSPSNPYQIGNTNLIKKIRYGLSKSYILTNDINLENTSWTPVGTASSPFTGTLDGANKTISNINISGTDNVGFFAFTSTGAQIKNLNIAGQVAGNEYVGGLVAINNGGTISNCNADQMLVTGVNFLSGLIANNISGTVSGSTPAVSQVLVLTGFPTLFSGLGTVTKPLNVSPGTAAVTLSSIPEKIEAKIESGNITITAQAGFISGEMQANITLGNVSTSRTITLFAEEQFDDGDGTSSNPYLISKASQFSRMRDFPAAHFRLTENINLADLGEWIALPSFSGVLDGNGKTINGLINTNVTTKGGLVVNNSGVIKNLRVLNVNIATSVPFGTIAGDNSGTIENIVLTGNLTSTNTGDLLGGIAAEMTSGKITNCYVNLDIVSSCGMTAAILGRARTTASEVSNCTVEGNISITGSKSRIAGIVARGESAVVIKNCLSNVNITSVAEGVNGVGGIFGADNGAAMRIDECMFTGTITAAFNIGGIAGVGPNVRNCLVEGAGSGQTASTLRTTGAPNPGSVGGITGVNKTILSHSIARDITIRGTSGLNAKMAGISSAYQNNGYTTKSVVVNASMESANVQRISGSLPTIPSVLSDNYAADVTVTLPEGVFTADSNKDGWDGETKTTAELTQAFYQALGYDFTNIWKWENDKPYLRNVGYKGNLIIP